MSDYPRGGIVPDRMGDMARRIEELERDIADLTRQNQELRETVKALLAPTRPPGQPQFYQNPSGLW